MPFRACRSAIFQVDGEDGRLVSPKISPRELRRRVVESCFMLLFLLLSHDFCVILRDFEEQIAKFKSEIPQGVEPLKGFEPSSNQGHLLATLSFTKKGQCVI